MHSQSLGVPSNPVVLIYNGLLLVVITGALRLLRQLTRRDRVVAFFLSGTVVLATGGAGALLSPIGPFGKVQLLAWATFIHGPVFLLGSGAILHRWRRGIALGCIGFAVGILGVGVDAFLIEPHWLTVDHVTLSTSELKTSVRVAVVADIQTDAPGPYERRVFRRVAAEQPDLILLAGDYVHLADDEQYVATGETLNQMMRDTELDAPLGVYAVRGNVDWPDRWQEIFDGLPVTTFEHSRTLDLGPLVLTGLALHDSANTKLTLPPEDAFHIVLGHVPNFSLGQVEGDVLIAGHTHGGQVQLPLVGPLMTLSKVPRSWASGVTEIAPGKTLIVSRGIGMERGNAPRMRFLCRPQLVILDLVSAEP